MPDVEVIETTALARLEPQDLLKTAVEKGSDIATIEKFVALAKEVVELQAKQAFFRAMAAFKADCPQIYKRRTANLGNFSYKFADLGDEDEVIAEPLSKHGLSYRWEIAPVPEDKAKLGPHVALECIVQHALGHQQRSGVVRCPCRRRYRASAVRMPCSAKDRLQLRPAHLARDRSGARSAPRRRYGRQRRGHRRRRRARRRRRPADRRNDQRADGKAPLGDRARPALDEGRRRRALEEARRRRRHEDDPARPDLRRDRRRDQGREEGGAGRRAAGEPMSWRSFREVVLTALAVSVVVVIGIVCVALAVLWTFSQF